MNIYDINSKELDKINGFLVDNKMVYKDKYKKI